MPIQGLTHRGASFPQIGVIRKGAPKGANRPGEDLSYFRVEFDESEAESAAEFRRVYGDAPTRINVWMPFHSVDENWTAWREAYVAGGLVHRCDGSMIQRAVDPESGAVLVNNGEPPTPCIHPKPAGFYRTKSGEQKPIYCEPTARLKVIVPELKRMAFLMFVTTSIHDIAHIDAQLRGYESVQGGLRAIPFVLVRKPAMISSPGADGKRMRRKTYLISIEANPEWVAAKASALAAASFPALSAPSDTEPESVVEIEEAQWIEAPELSTAAVSQPETGPVSSPAIPRDQEITAAASVVQTPQTSTRPLAPDVLRRFLARKAEIHEKSASLASVSQRGLLVGLLDDVFETPGVEDGEPYRRTVLGYLFDVDSVIPMANGQVLAALDWLKPEQDSGGLWLVDKMAATECFAVYTERMAQLGQQAMFPATGTPASPSDPTGSREIGGLTSDKSRVS